MKEYLEQNKKSFETLAQEYQGRWRKYLGHQEKVLKPFKDRLRRQFNDPIKILDVGCGVGLDLYILANHGFQTYGLDFSPKMVSYARRNSPISRVIVADFLDETINDKFQGIVMDAFLHLFPSSDTAAVLARVKTLLVPGGYGLICTTLSEESKEGYVEKSDYSKAVRRFKKFWTKEELIETLEINGLKVIDFYTDYEENFNKHWMNVIFQNQNGNPV